MTPTTREGSEAKIGGPSRTVREGAQADQEMMGVVTVVSIDETGVVIRRKEMTDEVAVLNADPLRGVTMVEIDVTADSRKGATTSRETVPGKSRADLDRSSGPHWPQERTGSIAGKGPLLCQVR